MQIIDISKLFDWENTPEGTTSKEIEHVLQCGGKAGLSFKPAKIKKRGAKNANN